jgi:hypothetical protein
VIPCAFLRVYRPLDAFDDADRVQWERYILSGGHPPSRRRIYREESVTDRRFGLLASIDGEYADVRLIDGTYYVCPWQTRMRILASILSLHESSPLELIDAVVPDSEARRAARELARLKRREPRAVPSMLQSPWHVPVRWFVLVDDDERRLVQAPDGSDRMYYWTTIRQAKQRAERAAHVLRRTDLDPLAKLVRDLGQWLGSHPPSSAIELDYGSLCSLFAWDELDNDRSARDVQQAILALAGAGGVARAAELYQTVASRWAEARGREALN